MLISMDNGGTLYAIYVYVAFMKNNSYLPMIKTFLILAHLRILFNEFDLRHRFCVNIGDNIELIKYAYLTMYDVQHMHIKYFSLKLI